MARPTVPPGFRAISEEAAKKILLGGTPGLITMYIGHDDWCNYFKTNDPSSCNCNPEVEFYRVSKRKAGRR